MIVVQTEYGKQVAVHHKIHKTSEQHPVIEITAVCGNSRHSGRITIGAVDGPLRIMPPDQMAAEVQGLLDRKRAEYAERAAWKETMWTALDSLQ